MRYKRGNDATLGLRLIEWTTDEYVEGLFEQRLSLKRLWLAWQPPRAAQNQEWELNCVVHLLRVRWSEHVRQSSYITPTRKLWFRYPGRVPAQTSPTNLGFYGFKYLTPVSLREYHILSRCCCACTSSWNLAPAVELRWQIPIVLFSVLRARFPYLIAELRPCSQYGLVHEGRATAVCCAVVLMLEH